MDRPDPFDLLRATVVVPGSKSATARAYVLAALADAPSTLTGALDARDTCLMRAALSALGVRFDDLPGGRVVVTPPAHFTAHAIEVGLAGTITMRFAPPLAPSPTGPACSTVIQKLRHARSPRSWRDSPRSAS